MISSISIDRFGDIDTLDLDLGELNHVERSSGGDSLFLMLRAMKQSYVPGYLHDWEEDRWSCGSGFGGGKLEVRGRLFDGGTFARCLHKGSPYCSCRVEFVLENPENPVCGCGMQAGVEETGPRVGAETAFFDKKRAGAAQTGPRVGAETAFFDKKRAGADDFRELCRLYDEKFNAVRRFVVGAEDTFAPRKNDNILSYQMISVRCERVWEADITSFFELVLYKNGTNYELYWEELPDIRGMRQNGRAKGCNVRMDHLQIQNIVTDGVQDGARFEEVLPSVVLLSGIAARQFGTVKVLDFEKSDSYAPIGVPDQPVSIGVPDLPASIGVPGSCRFVGIHGQYTEAVLRTYADEGTRIPWPDPKTGEIRRGSLQEAFEAWRRELGDAGGDADSADDGEACIGMCGEAVDVRRRVRGDAEVLAALVQGLILRTSETLIIRGMENKLPRRFQVGLACLGKQLILVTK